MRVAVIGSWPEPDSAAPGETTESVHAACRRVGRELIERGHSLIVGVDGPDTAGGQAVVGAIEALPAAPSPNQGPRIAVIRPASPERPFYDLRRRLPGVFVEQVVDAASWAVVKTVQIQQADAAILLGGGPRTEQAGLTAAVCGKPLACIGSFGGTAAALNERFISSPAAWNYPPGQATQLQQLQEPFSDVVLHTALAAAWIEGAPKLMIIHGRSPDRDVLNEFLMKSVGQPAIVLAEKFLPTEPIPLKFERYAASVDGAIALVTPDDVGGPAGDAAPEPRARENVWIEVGWFWGRRGRSKLLLLRKNKANIPSDLGNVEFFDYTDSLDPCGPAILRFIARLRSGSDADAED